MTQIVFEPDTEMHLLSILMKRGWTRVEISRINTQNNGYMCLLQKFTDNSNDRN